MTDAPKHSLSLVRYHIDEVSSYHRNPRRGDVETIAESLQINGQYRPIVVNLGRLTGRPLEVLAGNHTLAAARALGWAEIAATTIDVDDVEAARIVVADNRIGDLAENDHAELVALLQGLPDLDGTGYTDDDLTALIGEVPDFEPSDDEVRLDEMNPKICQRCGYDVNNNPDGLKIEDN